MHICVHTVNLNTLLKYNYDYIQASNSTSRYLGDLLNIDNPYFEGMAGRIYRPEL